MLIKRRNSPRRGRLASIVGLPGLVFLAASVTLLGAALATGMILGQRIEAKGQGSLIRVLSQSSFAMNVVDPGLSAVKAFAIDGANVPLNFMKGVATPTAVDRLVIDIKHENLQKIAAKREEALQIGVLLTGEDDWARADVTLNGVTGRAKVRLKGDWLDHVETDKWSLRINLSGDTTLLGMAEFSIQHPGTRNFVHEWVVHQALKREGILTPEYRFVDVTINGTHKGIYALEEHFTKHLIERASFREGPIIKFNEDLTWKEYVTLGTWDAEYGAFFANSIDGWAAETTRGSQFERAVGMLEGFRRRRYRTTDVFNVEKLAAFVAMRDLTGAEVLPWGNMRFYLNPVTSRLEPIAFDNAVDATEPIQQLYGFAGGLKRKVPGGVTANLTDDFVTLLFEDTAFYAAYVRALTRMSADLYVGELLAAIDDDLQRQLAILYQEFPYEEWSPDYLRRNQVFIRKALAPETAVHAYLKRRAPDGLLLDVGNIQSLPIEILGVSTSGGRPVLSPEPVVLRPRRPQQLTEYTPLQFPASAARPDAGAPLSVQWRVLGTDTVRSTVVQEWSYFAPELLGEDWFLNPPPLPRPYLVIDKASKTVIVKPGTWVVDRTLVVPPGYRVVAGPGVHLDLRNGAKLVSRSPLEFVGTEDAPVRIESSDGTGHGLLVLEAGEPSTLEHVVFDNLGALAENGWQLTGAVMFYESPVDIRDVLFRRSRSEDSLNIMRTRFTMTRTSFVDAKSDCFDGDFVTARIEDSTFVRCTNDAVDFSGSVAELERLRIEDMGDKGVSVGENSQLVARDLTIRRAEIGIASKDSSTVTATNVEIDDGGVGLVAFGKKPEFGSGGIHLTALHMSNMRANQLIEKGSRLTIDSQEQPAELVRVESMLYGAQYGRASR